MTERILRYIYSTRIPCPKCGSFAARKSGRSRGGRKRWRRCVACAHPFIVQPLAVEVDPGDGRASQVRFL
jgi:transposase-like protein